MEQRAYRVREVAEILGLNLNTVYRAIEAYREGKPGGLPAFRVGRCLRIPKSVIDELTRESGGSASDTQNDTSMQPELDIHAS